MSAQNIPRRNRIRFGWTARDVAFEALEARCLLSAGEPMSLVDGVVHIQGSDNAHLLTIEPYTYNTFAPDTPDHKLVITGTFHWVNFTLLIDGQDGVPDGYFSGNWKSQDIKQIIFDGSNTHASVTVLGSDDVELPGKIQLVGDRADYSVFRMSRAQYNADLFTRFADDIKTLDGNADDLILTSIPPVTNTDVQVTPQPATSTQAQSLPPFSTQPVPAVDTKKDDDALWA